MAAECLLQHRETAGLRCEPFDGADAGAVSLHGKRKTRPRGYAVDVDGAGTAHPVLAADVCAGEAEFVPQKVGEQHARLGFAFDGAAVDLETDGVAGVGAQMRHRRASSTVWRPSSRTSMRR